MRLKWLRWTLGILICLLLSLPILTFFPCRVIPVSWRAHLLGHTLIPSEVHESWVEPLNLRGSFKEKELPEYQDLLRRDNDRRKLFLKIYQAGKGRAGLTHGGGTMEGDPIVEWIMVDDGKLLLIEDATRDRYAGFPGVFKFSPTNAALGYFQNNKFIEHDPGTNTVEIRLVVRGPKFSYRYF
jgi:hypothetical protein